jgi:hypothetical protein
MSFHSLSGQHLTQQFIRNCCPNEEDTNEEGGSAVHFKQNRPLAEDQFNKL